MPDCCLTSLPIWPSARYFFLLLFLSYTLRRFILLKSWQQALAHDNL